MTADTTQTLLAAERSSRPRKALRLGFNTRVSFNSGPGGAERGLRDALCVRVHPPQEDTVLLASGRRVLGA